MDLITKARIEKVIQLCINSYMGKHGQIKRISNNEELFNFKDKTDDMTFITAFDGNDCYMCFQGSQQKSDWWRNIDTQKIDLNDDTECHEGFFEHVNKFRLHIRKHLRLLTDNHFERLIICGHSLGAAIATLVCYEILWKLYPDDVLEKVLCVTLGSPRVGNDKFVEYFNKKFECYRLVYGKDIVTRIPKWLYYHVGELVHLGPNRWFSSFEDHRPLRYKEGFQEYISKNE